jgi:hypothetical protein
MGSGGVIYKTSFMTIGSDNQLKLSLLPQQFWGCSVGISKGMDL